MADTTQISYEANDLILYAENDWDTYQEYERMKARLQRFAAAGTYDIERATTLWFHLMTSAARRYEEDGIGTRTAQQRHEAAVAFEAQERAEIFEGTEDTTDDD